MTRDQYAEIIKHGFFTIAKENAMRVILANFTWLSTSTLGSAFVTPVVSALVGWVLEKALDGAEMVAFFLYIDLRVNKQANEFSDAALANWNAQQGGTEEEKGRAKVNLINAHKQFVKLTN